MADSTPDPNMPGTAETATAEDPTPGTNAIALFTGRDVAEFLRPTFAFSVEAAQ